MPLDGFVAFDFFEFSLLGGRPSYLSEFVSPNLSVFAFLI